jgi:hypothetical protein
VTGKQTVWLDAAATEVLISYFRVMRAYVNYSGTSKEKASQWYKQVIWRLKDILQQGRKMANSAEISGLIVLYGCAHEWATQNDASE